MRHCKTLTLSDGRDATVHELRVRDMRRIIAALPDLKDQPLQNLLSEHLPDALDLLADGLTLPAGETLDDLTVSECEALARAWWDLHKGFFGPLLAAGRSALAAQTTSDASTAPVSHSRQQGTASASGTTDGASTSTSST